MLSERRVIDEIETSSSNLYEWTVEIENDIEDIRQTSKNPHYLNNIRDLLDETQLLYKMILVSIHEFSSLMTDDSTTKSLFNKLAELRQRSINCLKILLEIFGTCPRSIVNVKDNNGIEQKIEPQNLKFSKDELEMTCSDWDRHFQVRFLST